MHSMHYPIVQPTFGDDVPIYREPAPEAPPAPTVAELLGKAAQKCLLAGAACAGVQGSRRKTGMFDGVVADHVENTAGSRDRFIVETMPSLKQLQRAEKVAKEKNVSLADTLHHMVRQEHLKDTLASFHGRKQRGVLRFLMLDADAKAEVESAVADGPLLHKPLQATQKKMVDGQRKAVAAELRRVVPAAAHEPTVVATGGSADDKFAAAPHKSSAVDWWESNVAGIGTDEDRALRKRAAETEPAWKGVGQAPGVEAFRIEQFKVVPWAAALEGTFHEGDSYVFLHTFRAVDIEGEETDKLCYRIHFWLGRTTPIDAMGTAAYKTVELDDLLDGQASQHREVMGSESADFHALFAKVKYVAGGAPSGFRKVCDVDLDNFEPRILRITRVGRQTVIVEVPCTRESLHQEAAFIIDLGKSLYMWSGSESSVHERNLARVTIEQLEVARAGKSTIMNLPDEGFWSALGGDGPIANRARDAIAYTPPTPGGGLPLGHGALYRLSDSTGSLSFDEVAKGQLQLNMLLDDAVFVCDPGTELMVWMGKGASDRERRAAMLTAQKYLALHGKPHTTPIKVFKSMNDAMNDESFAQIFAGC